MDVVLVKFVIYLPIMLIDPFCITMRCPDFIVSYLFFNYFSLNICSKGNDIDVLYILPVWFWHFVSFFTFLLQYSLNEIFRFIRLI